VSLQLETLALVVIGNCVCSHMAHASGSGPKTEHRPPITRALDPSRQNLMTGAGGLYPCGKPLYRYRRYILADLTGPITTCKTIPRPGNFFTVYSASPTEDFARTGVSCSMQLRRCSACIGKSNIKAR
jgi:hypothetical protein